jgi:uncharacterized protein YyaL (SSP411 family)
MAHNESELRDAYLAKDKNYTPRTKHLVDGKAEFVNHLILEKSPYLLQHAHNPVNWHTFGDEAFAKAKAENKLIFLSSGYATCHWCHVMEEESFENLEVAKILNDNFVAIKVDREILPDVDNHFMNISILLNRSGGWPLNVILTPDGNGFYAFTYLPKHDIINTLSQLNTIWDSDKSRIISQANFVKKSLQDESNTSVKLNKNLRDEAVQNMLTSFDEFYGGFGNAPKFPKESALLMLINAQKHNPNEETLNVITTTLDNMATGGIYDVVGSGFHRYSVDNKWLVPHFEKMLYNQALLAQVYTRAYQLTKKSLYKKIAIDIINYVLREMQDKNGGFYSATDADSEGEEGTFFIWDIKEIKEILGTDFATFAKYFDLTESTIFEEKHIIRYKDITNLTKQDFAITDKLLNKLYQHRQQREKPLLDNKIILSWNALMFKSLAFASKLDEKYLEWAEKLAKFMQNFYKNNELYRIIIDKNLQTKALAVDYIYLADAYLELYLITNNNKYLELSQNLIDKAKSKFWDQKNYGFVSSNNKRISQDKPIYDGAKPSLNSVAYEVLVKLAKITQNENYKKLAKQLLDSFSAEIIKRPESYATIVNALTDNNLGIVGNKIYAYDGRVIIQRKPNQVIINLAKNWHINAHKVHQEGLIPTTLSGEITNINYPQGKLMKLGFAGEKVNIYENEVIITFQDNNPNKPLNLKLQACSDKVCLPPQEVILY